MRPLLNNWTARPADWRIKLTSRTLWKLEEKLINSESGPGKSEIDARLFIKRLLK
jgi:hypothetical protein